MAKKKKSKPKSNGLLGRNKSKPRTVGLDGRNKNEKLAEFFNVTTSTIDTWMKKHPKFLESIKRRFLSS